MAQLIFLNELSHAIDMHPDDARKCLNDLAAVAVQIRQLLPRLTLITAEPMASLHIGNNYSIVLWLNHSAKCRERARLLLSLAHRAPFAVTKELFGDPDPGVTVFRCDNEVVEGIGLAHLYGGLPISLCHDKRWRVASLRLQVEQLLENGEEIYELQSPHVSLLEHVEQHREFLARLRRRDIADAADLYTRRSELFPALEFGPSIKADLAALQPPAFLQVAEYLSNLDTAIGMWDPKARPAPDYPPHTTGESESRKKKGLCDFPAWGGGTEPHPMHGRYTPGAGRIYFRVEHGPKRAVLGYIGKKP